VQFLFAVDQSGTIHRDTYQFTAVCIEYTDELIVHNLGFHVRILGWYHLLAVGFLLENVSNVKNIGREGNTCTLSYLRLGGLEQRT